MVSGEFVLGVCSDLVGGVGVGWRSSKPHLPRCISMPLRPFFV